jgi:hypothetical protein
VISELDRGPDGLMVNLDVSLRAFLPREAGRMFSARCLELAA